MGKIASTLDIEEDERRDRLQKQWETYIKQLDDALKSEDPLSSPLVQQVIALSRHLFGKLNREEELRNVKLLTERDIVEMKKSHSPSIKQIIPIATQILFAFGAFGLGITPLAAGYTGSQAQGLKAGSDLANALGTGSGSVGHLMNSLQQGEQGEASQKIQATQRIVSDHEQSKRREIQQEDRTFEILQTQEKQKYDTFSQMGSS